MKNAAFLLAFVLVAGCGGESTESDASPYAMSREPVSVRGWIDDVAGAQRAETMEQEVARRTSLFQQTSVWVEKTQFASGGVAENGSFIVLDVPPGTATIGFTAPGADNAQLVLENIPGNADVLIPELVLRNGAVTVRDPKAIRVRIPSRVSEARPTGQNAMVAGVEVPIVETPLAQFADRREYPQPAGFRPVATFK